MKWIPRIAAIALSLAAIGVAVVSAQIPAFATGKTGDAEFTEGVMVGTTMLQPGHYRFKHTMQGGQHYLVVSGKGSEVARVPCQLLPLDAKIKLTELHSRKLADGSRVLTQIRIGGEAAGHLLVLDPKG